MELKPQSSKLLTKKQKNDVFKRLIDKDLSITELSHRMKYSRNYIYQVLNGKKNYTKEFDEKLNKALGENYEQ